MNSSTSLVTSLPPSGPLSSVTESTNIPRNIKRKLDDAIQSLDEAVSQADHPPPAKRQNTGRSLYSTLAKYGIKKDPKPSSSSMSKLDSLSKTAPHLAAILSRTATRTRKAMPFKSTPSSLTTSSSTSEYRPSSTTSFLSRLATFRLTTYANKPAAIDSVAAAKCGWINDGKDRLVCGICGVSWVVAGKDGMNKDAANTLVERQRAQLVDMHKQGCPWKTRQCDSSIYRIPLQAPATMAKEVKSRAVTLDSVLKDVEIKHPLPSSQVQTLSSIISSVSITAPPPAESESASVSTQDSEGVASTTSVSSPPEPSEVAILVSLFGWAILPPAPPQHHFQPPSISRANSTRGSFMSSSPVSSRSPSVSSISAFRNGIPTPSSPRPLIRMRVSQSAVVGKTKIDATVLHCSLCQRRVGLWAFVTPTSTEGPTSQPKRQLDVLREHRSYCPYVVRSTIIPSYSTAPPGHARSNSTPALASTASLPQLNGQNGAVEGWRAVLTGLLRYGASQRQRYGLGRSSSQRRPETPGGEGSTSTDTVTEEPPMDVDSVETMVAGVKTHGGRDLLKYVRGLLA